MEGKTMTTMMLAMTNAISVARRSPSPTNALLDDIEVGSFWWLTYAGISCFLVLFAGIMSGLTLGLMSLGLVDLEILQRSGTSQEKKQAATILPVVKKQHQLLVTLLLGNACAMEALPICLDKIFHPLVAVILSVTFVLAFGEVIPQAICTRYGLAVGANFVWLVRILMIVCYPIAYPVGKLLDCVLGHNESALFRRAQLKALVSIHSKEAGKGGELTHDETTIISGALDLTEKTAEEAMTPIESTFSLDVNSKLDWEAIGKILARGHSRVPVYSGNPKNIIGLLLVKSLLTVRAETETPVSVHFFTMASASSASSSSSALSLYLFTLFITLSHAQNSFRPKALVLPVVKDTATNQYVTTINQRTPLVPVKLVVDIGSRFMWVDCDDGYVSSTYRPALCGSAECSLAKANGCGNNTCGVGPDNPIIDLGTYGDLAADVLSVQSTDGSSPGQVVTVPRFLFSCAPTFLLRGLARGVKGMAGFGRNRIGLPSQFAAAFSLHRKFAICLTSSTSSNGAIFIGDGPYVFRPGTDVSKSLTYTPLIINPVSTAGSYVQGEPSYEYFIRVKSIKVSENRIPLNSSLLSIDSKGVGGTKISSVNPYTILESSIYKAVTNAFIRETNLTRVPPVAPFGFCFSSKNVGSTRVGPAVPAIDLVLQNENVYWRIFGANSVVSVNDKVMCLAFLDGGSNPRTSIVIGGHQLEDNLLQFDLATSRLGFTSTLFFMRTTCANFNFTSNAS